MALPENVGTYTLTSSLTIQESFGVRNISMLLVSGIVTVTGSMKLGSLTSSSLTLSADKPLNLSFDFPIDGLVIDATSGEVIIVTGK